MVKGAVVVRGGSSACKKRWREATNCSLLESSGRCLVGRKIKLQAVHERK